jgi:hypothetical protein
MVRHRRSRIWAKRTPNSSISDVFAGGIPLINLRYQSKKKVMKQLVGVPLLGSNSKIYLPAGWLHMSREWVSECMCTYWYLVLTALWLVPVSLAFQTNDVYNCTRSVRRTYYQYVPVSVPFSMISSAIKAKFGIRLGSLSNEKKAKAIYKNHKEVTEIVPITWK